MTDPIAILISHRVAAGRKADYVAHHDKLAELGKGVDGYGGVALFPPEDPNSREYTVLVHFGSLELLHAFWRSDEFIAWKKRLDQLVDAPAAVQYASGLERWVAAARHLQASAPPTYKMAVVVFCSILPLILVVPPLAATLLSGVHWLIARILTTAVIVLAMSYGAMPLITRLFDPWLKRGDSVRRPRRSREGVS